jgi:CubicO group peptidase (beta-lactamase class C family)
MTSSDINKTLLCIIVVALVLGCAAAPPNLTQVPSSSHADTPGLEATASSASSIPARLPDYWPTEGWRTSTAEEQGVDSAHLQAMIDAIKDQHLEIHSVLVVRNGYIIAETYFAPYSKKTRHPIYSVTKSVISALIGIAIQLGHIDGIDERVSDLLPERELAQQDGRKAAMTLEHLLAMTTGLDWEDGGRTFQEMYRSGDWVDYVLDRPITEEPGSQFNYCSGCSHVMSAIIQERSGMGTLEFAQKYLFGPLGITDAPWSTDGSGIPIGGWGLQMSSRDMAKLGYLYLNDGVWDGVHIIPTEWVELSLSQHIRASEELFYGYQWWIEPSSGAYAAIGLGGQMVYVIPDLDIVVVFTAGLDDTSVLFALIDDFVLPAVETGP